MNNKTSHTAHSKKWMCCFLLLCFSFWIAVESDAQSSGAITGKITDSQTGEELPGTTVRIKGTSTGTVSDIYGEYLLTLPAGEKVLTYSFLGYAEQEITVNVIAGTFTELNIQMQPDVLQMEEIVVTGQALGQMAAINQQINAKSIVNVVSKDKIESLPDQNAAESVGRLPGISIQREGGEGQKVVVRGLSPRFNAITINGERIPSSSAVDRSFDLSTLSADALQGIEVYKSWTPNLEGDAIGGTVNFITKKADAGWNGRVRYLHGYNGQQGEFGQHRFNGDIGNRFFEDKFGVIVSANFQRADRSQDRVNTDFDALTFDQVNQGRDTVSIININLEDRLETRDRYGATLALDYTLKKGEIKLFSNYSRTDRDQVRRRRRYRFDTRRQEYEFIEEQSENILIANTLSGNYNLLNKIEISWSGSYSQTTIRTPYQNRIRFRENSAYVGLNAIAPSELEIIDAARNDLGSTFLQVAESDDDDIDFTRITAQLDLAYPVQISDKIVGSFKGGGKYRLDDRTRDIERLQMRQAVINDLASESPAGYDVANENILISSFLGDFVADDFFDNEYYLGPGSGLVNGGHLNADAANGFRSQFADRYRRNLFADAGDYFAEEAIVSFYAMGDFKIGDKINVLAGVRNETTTLDYTGFEVIASASEAEVDPGDDPRVNLIENSNDRTYSEWLPAINVKYAATEWFDVRAAVTRTLSRPNFQFLVPFVITNNDQRSIDRGNFDLQHQVATNYDLFLSFYNKLGLFTVGGFYKEIDDIDFVRLSNVTPITPNTANEQLGYDLTQPENAQGITTVQGIEIDFQTNLSSLPPPWNGIVFSANATFIESETLYPDVFFAQNPLRPINDVREGTLIGQPEQVYNVSVGYEKGGFSGRFSVIHQANTFGLGDPGDSGELGGLEAELLFDDQFDAFTGRTTRYDLSLSQKITKQLQIIFNANNISNQRETTFIRDGQRSEGQIFGLTLDLGVMYKFK
ncbi:MAG: TonB-dependent receptor [Bacteroidota bacterium]